MLEGEETITQTLRNERRQHRRESEEKERGVYVRPEGSTMVANGWAGTGLGGGRRRKEGVE